ncbi:hypothetical protein BBI11_08490 [Planococcus maritimus]|nr:hypothetical protein BBI11_08490 [Planococcus maritimus]
MRFCFLTSQSGVVYPLSLVFFLSALTLLSHMGMLYTIEYQTYDSLENVHRNATIQLLMEIGQNKIPK